MKIEKTWDKEKETSIIQLNGELLIDNVVELKNEILNEISENHKIVIDLNALKEIDLSAIQLLFSVYQTAVSKNIKISIKGKNNQTIMKRFSTSNIFPIIEENDEVQNETTVRF